MLLLHHNPFFVSLPPLFIRLYLSSLEERLASLTSSHLCSLVSLLHVLTLLIKALRDVAEIPSDLALAALRPHLHFFFFVISQF